MNEVIVEKWKREDAVEFCHSVNLDFLADMVETMPANDEGTVTLYRAGGQFYINEALAQYVAEQNELLADMRVKEANRKIRAHKDFLARMNELEYAAVAELDAMVRTAKHKVLKIEERLWGSKSNIIERMLGVES